MSWDPPFDECKDCKFFKRSKPAPVCKFCTCGEFFGEKEPDDDPSFDKLMSIFERMSSAESEDRTPLESDAITAASEISDED